MKIFRYKVTIDEIERIVSVGVEVKNIRMPYIDEVDYTPKDYIAGFIANPTIGYFDLTTYSFAHTILNPKDKHDERIELGRLNKIISGLDTYDFNIPTMFNSYGAMKSFAFSYCTKVMHNWCDTRGIKSKIKVEDYII